MMVVIPVIQIYPGRDWGGCLRLCEHENFKVILRDLIISKVCQQEKHDDPQNFEQ